ncbi:unnamed protein product [Trichobilharzia szidati]|nr:unnamed protein product [Trichobilharzia szidati]
MFPKKELLIFGGATKSGPLNQLLRLHLDDLSVPKAISTENSSVFEIQSFTGSIKQSCNHTNPACKSRTQHSSVSLTEYDQLLIFSGGDVGSQTVSDDKVHMYDSVLDSWIKIPVEGISPCSRLGHLMLYESPCQLETSNAEHRIPKGKLYIHGGMADDELFDDLYALHFAQCDNGDVHFKGVWSKLYPNINADAINSNENSNTPHLKSLGYISPGSRAAHGGAILTNKIFGSDTTKIFIFGGFSKTGALNDMFCFDTNLKQWSEIKCETGILPGPRLDFAYCVVTMTVQKKNAKIKLVELTSNSLKDDQSTGDTNEEEEEEESNDEEKSSNHHNVDAYCQDYFFIHGGMDTEGKVFNDAYLLLLSEYQISNPMNFQTILNECNCKNV